MYDFEFDFRNPEEHLSEKEPNRRETGYYSNKKFGMNSHVIPL